MGEGPGPGPGASPGPGPGPSPAASLAKTLLSQPSTSSSHCPSSRAEVKASQLQLGQNTAEPRPLRPSHLLELEQEGALVLAPAVLLHALLDEPVQDGGDGLRADPLQQLQLGTERRSEAHPGVSNMQKGNSSESSAAHVDFWIVKGP